MKGRREIFSKVNELMGDAAHSIDYSTTPTGLIRAYKAHADALEHAAKSGAKVRLLSQITSENSSLAAEFQEIVDFKPIQNPLPTFICVDSKELVVIESMPEDVRTDRGSDTAAWTTNRLLVELFERLFNEVWQSIPVKESR
jgi:sugar-specific transcriptional regulator TrmB